MPRSLPLLAHMNTSANANNANSPARVMPNDFNDDNDEMSDADE